MQNFPSRNDDDAKKSGEKIHWLNISGGKRQSLHSFRDGKGNGSTFPQGAVDLQTMSVILL